MLLKYFKLVCKKIIKSFSSPNNYAEMLGVSFGENCKFLTKEFGSEPYLITMGKNVELSFGVVFINHDGALWVVRNKYVKYRSSDLIKRINIGDNVFVGARTTILPGVDIGDDVIIGAGSLVNKKLESGFVYAGVPARKISSLDEYIEKNRNKFINTKEKSPLEKRDYLERIL
ncbi:acyltransferase [Vibrio splendidus]|uniref:acyltransferase n=1 Tax=Vibrio splendidus TaxID=29497 RepID=UPI000D38CAFC|nr:acyltransferase [Vibrio splendidus]PTP66505.1 capsule biosynthesis protein CapG [Vibrio splendidus]